MKKLFYFLSMLVLILMLAWMTPSDKVNVSFDKNLSMVEFSKQVMNVGVIFSVNQAASFSHWNQVVIDYVFITLLVFFLIGVVNYQWYKPTKSPPPWYMCLRFSCRNKISGWKTTNVQHKAFLAHQQ